MSEGTFNTGLKEAKRFYFSCLDLNDSANRALEQGEENLQEAIRLYDRERRLHSHQTLHTRVFRVRGLLDLTWGTNFLRDYLNSKLEELFNQCATSETRDPYLDFPEELGIGTEVRNLRPGAFVLDGALRVESRLISRQVGSLIKQIRAASFNPENFFEAASNIACHIREFKTPYRFDYRVDPDLGFNNTPDLVNWLHTIMMGKVPFLPERLVHV